MTLKGVNAQWLEQLFETALDLKRKGRTRFPPSLLGRPVATIFLEPSTRTKVSFTLAAQALQADVVDLSPETSSMIKGESLLDTLKTLEAEGAAYAVIRLKPEGTLSKIAPQTAISVLNAGEGTTEHPTQALGDVLALRAAAGSLKGLRVCFFGDAAYSRVFSSSSIAFKQQGAEVAVCSMPELAPSKKTFGGKRFTDYTQAAQWAEVLYGLRFQKERHEKAVDMDTY
ncbi:MAG: aspartate carbamoyltransferase catalytic subunit, partial [bacterium]